MRKIGVFLKILLPYGIILLLLFAIFWQVIFKGYVFIDGDNFHLNMPLKYFLVDAFRNRFFPFWNPYIFAGVPYAADLNLGTLNPLNVIYLFFPVQRALTLQVIVDLFFVGCFQFLFLQRIRCERLSALVGAIVFMFSGSVFAFTSNIAVLNTIVYIPIIFLFAHLYLQAKKLRYFSILIILQILQVISGHPQITYYTILAVCFYILFQSSFTLRNRLIILGCYIVFTTTLTSFQLVPFLQLVVNSNRLQNNIAYATSGSLDIFHLISFVFPMFFGTKLQGNWWGNQAMLIGYIGITSLILFAFGILKGKITRKIFFILSLIISFLLSLGKFAGIFYLFYFFVPGWSAFRSPSMMIVFTTFFASIFVASGVTYFLKSSKKITFCKYFAAFGFIVFLVSLWLLLFSNNLHLLAVLRYVSEIIPQVGKIFFYSDVKILGIFSTIVFSFLFASFFIFTTSIVVWTFPQKIRGVSIMLFICLELLLVDRTYLQLAPLNFYENNCRIINLNDYEYRVFAKPVVPKQDKRFFPGYKYFYNESLLNLREYTDNHVVEQKMQAITGYNAIVLKNYAAFTDSMNVTGITPQKLSNSMLDTLSVKYILSLDSKGKLIIVKRQTELPRVRLVLMSGNVSMTKNMPNTVSIIATASKPDTVVLADSYYPGWEATVNGKKQALHIYQDTFLSVSIPKGNSTVVFFYNPWIWELGFGISLLALISGTSCLYIFRKYV